jgi:cyclic pyranopterin monophosphate synthase
MAELTHIDQAGNARMVDVGGKAVTTREACTQVSVSLNEDAFSQIVKHSHKKGDVLTVAKIAGIQAAKRTSDLIPLCHPLALDVVEIDFELNHEQRIVLITSTCKTTANTGVEMEALTASGVAALTIYDMCKAVDRAIKIDNLHLLTKSGGQSGDYQCD